MRVALKSARGLFVGAEDGGGGDVDCRRDAIGPEETFTLTDLGNGDVSLQAMKGQYLCAENGGRGRVMANRGALGPWERFRLIDRGNGMVALQVSNGQYFHADSGFVWASGDAIGQWETFQLIGLGSETRRGRNVALKSGDGRFVGAVNGGGAEVVGDRKAAGPDETFTMIRQEDGRVSFQARTGHYLTVDYTNGVVRADRVTFGMEATFRLVDLGANLNALEIYRRPTDHGSLWYARGGSRITIGQGGLDEKDQFELIVLSVSDEGWMEAAYDKIKDKTLAQLCLPGTHDSGTYELFPDIAPDAEEVVGHLWAKARVGGATALDAFIKGMAVTQTKTFYQQLQHGARYIDLRVCFMNGQFYTCHTLRGNLISILMKDVKRFLDENPKEIVVFKVGFKETADQRNNPTPWRDDAWREISRFTSPYFYRPTSIRELLGKRFSELVDVRAPKRAIFLPDSAENIHGIYNSSITTNSGVIQNLQSQTASFRGGKLLEAQFIRPVDTEGFVKAYVQKHGCRIMGIFPILLNVPIFGSLLMTIISAGGGGTLLPAALVAYLLYVRNFKPVPTDLRQNAKDSRSILTEYIRWLAANPSTKPQLLMCDFIEDLPLVEIAIRISTGQTFEQLVNGVSDIRPFPPDGERAVIFDCTGQAFASAFLTARYGVEEAGKWLINQLGLAARPLNQALRSAGYAGKEIVKFFNSLGGEFKKIFDTLGRALNPRNWVRAVSTDPNAPPRSAAETFIDKLEEEEFRNELLPAFADVSEGDWDAVVQIAKTAGYELTVEELKQAVPEGFFLGAGEYPELGWNRSALPP